MNIKPGVYEHFTGKLYRFVAIGKHSDTMEDMVIYQALYDNKQIWVRPAHEWNEMVLVEEKSIPRFRWIREA